MVKSADRKPEKYIGSDGKPRIRMVPVDKEVIKTEAAPKVDLAKYAAHLVRNKKPKKMTSTQKTLADISKRANEKYEAYETEPPSPDEKSMAMRQAKFIQYVGEELMEYMEQEKDFPEWMQNKLSELHQKAKDMHAVLAGEYEDDDMDEEMNMKEEVEQIEELTAAEKKLINQMYDKKGNLTPLGKKVFAAGQKNEAYDPKHVKQAVGIASDPRYKGGNMTGATKVINKLSKGLSDHPQVKAVLKRQNEGLKTFNEISKGLAGRYIKKAQVSTADAAKSNERGHTDSRSPDRDIAKAGSNQAKKGIKTFINRNKGTSTAVDKLTGKAKVPAKEGNVSEISNNKMGQYVRKAADDAAKKGAAGDTDKAKARVKGVSKAMDKMDKNRLFGRQ